MHAKWMCCALTQGIRIKTFTSTKRATADKFITINKQTHTHTHTHTHTQEAVLNVEITVTKQKQLKSNSHILPKFSKFLF